jgi:hypothetical protein
MPSNGPNFFWQEEGRFRRLFNRLDPTRLLELAVGHGRHAERSASLAGQLWVVDVLAENIAACRARLGGFANVSFIVNDGFSFQPLADGSITGIYCYDAMVHSARSWWRPICAMPPGYWHRADGRCSIIPIMKRRGTGFSAIIRLRAII